MTAPSPLNNESQYYEWLNRPDACAALMAEAPPAVTPAMLAAPAGGEQPLLAPPAVGGTFGWNMRSDKPAPHIRSLNEIENQGFLSADCPKSVLKWTRLGGRLGVPGMPAATSTLHALMGWLRCRPRIVNRMQAITAGDSPPGIHWANAGWWLTVHLTPNQAWQGGQVAPAPPRAGYRRSFHATSMYCCARIIHQGLQEGMARNSNGRKIIGGIFSHAAERSHLCLGYCHFLALPGDSSGNLVGPLAEIHTPEHDPLWRPAVLRRADGNHQWLSYNDTTELVAMHWFVVHPAVFLLKGLQAPDSRLWIRAEANYNAELELDPDEDWQSICARSKPANGIVG